MLLSGAGRAAICFVSSDDDFASEIDKLDDCTGERDCTKWIEHSEESSLWCLRFEGLVSGYVVLFSACRNQAMLLRKLGRKTPRLRLGGAEKLRVTSGHTRWLTCS